VHRKSDAKEGVLTQLYKNLMDVAPKTALYREAPLKDRSAVLFFCNIRNPSQTHQIQWFGAYEKRVGDASACQTASFGLLHRMGLAEEHQVHLHNFQTHHAPAVE